MRHKIPSAAGKVVTSICTVALALGLMPCYALAGSELRSGDPTDLEMQVRADKASRIDSASDAFEDGSIIVVYREGAAASRKAKRGMSVQSASIAGLPDATAQVLSPDSGTPGGGVALHVDLPSGTSVGEAVVTAQADPDVLIAQPNYVYYLADESNGPQNGTVDDGRSASGATLAVSNAAPRAVSDYPLPNDPLVGIDYNDTAQSPSTPNQWWLHAVGAPQAWSIAHGDDNPVAVAVLDTGIDFDHEDLKNNILSDYAYDAYYDQKLTDSIDDDEMAHGCHVAGIVAAEANNAIGIAGVSYNAKILPIRVFHLAFNAAQMRNVATCSDEDLIRAYDYLLSDKDGNGLTVAQETNTHVVNMSLGGYLQDGIDLGEDPKEAYDYLFEDKIEQAEAAGILTVAAAGNGDDFGNARTDASYPSDYPAVMSVVALRTLDTRTQWSDHNAMKNIAAPGNNVYSTYWTGTPPYKFQSGTSMAAPVVAGCAALLWAYDPALTVRDVKDILYGTADDLGAEGFDEYYGWGRVNIGAALTSLGTASVSLESTTMVRTTSQQLSASQISDRTAAHTWKWSIDDESVARVNETGMLTAVAPGRVAVTATAVDDPSIEGRRTVEVIDIAVPGALVASANPQRNTISLSWNPAEAAVRYKVMRATAAYGSTSEPGDFNVLGVFDAAALMQGTGMTFVDEAAKPSELYWYRVVPVGNLDGALVDGLEVTSNRCFYTEKGPLKANIDMAEELLSSTESSEDGSDVLVGAWWAAPEAHDELNKALSGAYGAYMSGTMLQVKVDYCNDALAQAIAVFKGERKAGLKKVPNTLDVRAAASSHEVVRGEAKVFAPSELYVVTGAQGAVSYELYKGPAGVTVAPDGTLTVSGSVALGTHAVTVNVAAAGTDAALAKTVAVNVYVTVSEPAAPESAEDGKGSKDSSGKTDPGTTVRAANGLAASGKSVTVAYSAGNPQVISSAKLFSVKGANGTVSYRKTSGNARLTMTSKGKVTIARGASVGTYRASVAVTAAGDAGHVAKTVHVTISVKVGKAANPLIVKAAAKVPVVSGEKLAKRSQVVKRAKVLQVINAKGGVAYRKVSGAGKITVSKAGKLTVKKGLKKGTYAVKVRVNAAGTSNYKAISKTVTAHVKVK